MGSICIGRSMYGLWSVGPFSFVQSPLDNGGFVPRIYPLQVRESNHLSKGLSVSDS